jgi:hypothetical protein
LQFEKVREKLHIRKQQAFVRNAIIESTPHENKMAGKGQITSERANISFSRIFSRFDKCEHFSK